MINSCLNIFLSDIFLYILLISTYLIPAFILSLETFEEQNSFAPSYYNVKVQNISEGLDELMDSWSDSAGADETTGSSSTLVFGSCFIVMNRCSINTLLLLLSISTLLLYEYQLVIYNGIIDHARLDNIYHVQNNFNRTITIILKEWSVENLHLSIEYININNKTITYNTIIEHHNIDLKMLSYVPEEGLKFKIWLYKFTNGQIGIKLLGCYNA